MTPTETRIVFHEGLWRVAKAIIIAALLTSGLWLLLS